MNIYLVRGRVPNGGPMKYDPIGYSYTPDLYFSELVTCSSKAKAVAAVREMYRGCKVQYTRKLGEA